MICLQSGLTITTRFTEECIDTIISDIQSNFINCGQTQELFCDEDYQYRHYHLSCSYTLQNNFSYEKICIHRFRVVIGIL